MYPSPQRAIFLDRDGVINQENGYIRSWEDFILLPKVIETIRLINRSGYLAIVITNQSGIAKGIYSEKDVVDIHDEFSQLLAKHHAYIDAYYFCPHHPEGTLAEYSMCCNCRKPGNGLLLQAAKDFGIDLQQSFFIGDAERDIIAGKKSGCTTYGVQTGHGFSQAKITADFTVADMSEAVKNILQLS